MIYLPRQGWSPARSLTCLPPPIGLSIKKGRSPPKDGFHSLQDGANLGRATPICSVPTSLWCAEMPEPWHRGAGGMSTLEPRYTAHEHTGALRRTQGQVKSQPCQEPSCSVGLGSVVGQRDTPHPKPHKKEK